MKSTWAEVQARVARAIRDRRIELDLSQPDLARLSDLSRRRIQQIEDAEVAANPSLRVLHRIATALGEDLVDLLKPDRQPAMPDRKRRKKR